MRSVPTAVPMCASLKTLVMAMVLAAGGLTAPRVQATTECHASAVADASTPDTLRAIFKQCESQPQTAALALRKLNALPPTPEVRVSLQPLPMPGDEAERGAVELDLFFYAAETYPPAAALENLEALVEHMNEGFAVESLRIVGGSESLEEDGDVSAVALGRASFVRDYLARAGLGGAAALPVETTRPFVGNDAESRARARVVTLEVSVLRHRAPAGEP